MAARSLQEGRAWLEGRLGVTLQPGGKHPAFGTHNLLLSLGPDAYLEVISTYPDAPAPDGLEARGRGFDTPSLLGLARTLWGRRTRSLRRTALAELAASRGLDPDARLLAQAHLLRRLARTVEGEAASGERGEAWATRLDRLVALAKRETAAFDEQALRRRAV